LEIDSKYTYSLTSVNLTKLKRDEIYKLAYELREHKNNISIEIASNLFNYLEMSKYDFMTEMLKKYRYLNISSHFYKQIYIDIFTSYINKFEAVKHKIKFKNKVISKIIYYKIDKKTHR
jgi:flavin-dependent dehydrogenase